jgi:hypothetical protein
VPHRLFLSGWQGQQALKPATIVYNRLPNWIPTMFRNQTTGRVLNSSIPVLETIDQENWDKDAPLCVAG